MKPEDTRAQKSEPHETAASLGRRDDGHEQKADATEASSDRPRDTADENAGGCSHPDLPAGDSAVNPDNGDDELPEFEDLPEEQVVTKTDHLEDQVQQLKSTVAILKSLADVERVVDEVGELFNTETCNTDDDWEYLLALVGEAARQDIDDPYDRAAYVVDRWCYELLHEPDAPNGGSYEFITDGGEDVASEWTLECMDCDWEDSATADIHPTEGPPKAVEKAVRLHKNTTDESHTVRVKGTHVVDDRDVDPSLLTDGGFESGTNHSLHVDSSAGNTISIADNHVTPDPATAHSQNLLGRRVRIDWGSREEAGEIRNVNDDIERGRTLRVGIPNDDGGLSRCVRVDPTDVDLEVLPDQAVATDGENGGDSA